MNPIDLPQSAATEPHPSEIHPHAAQWGASGFDWASLYESLGESSDPRADAMHLAAAVIAQLVDWISAPAQNHSTAAARQKRIFHRTLVAVWSIDPTMRSGAKPKPLAEVARQYGIHPICLHKLSGDFARRFGVFHRHHAKAWNRKRVANEPSFVGVNLIGQRKCLQD